MSASEIRDLGLTDTTAGCACCAPSGHTRTSAIPSDAIVPSIGDAVVADYLVDGMTCSHCARSVTEELSTIAGVTDVDVSLNAGGISRVRVASAAPLDSGQVRDAVEEAGYTLAPMS